MQKRKKRETVDLRVSAEAIGIVPIEERVEIEATVKQASSCPLATLASTSVKAINPMAPWPELLLRGTGTMMARARSLRAEVISQLLAAKSANPPRNHPKVLLMLSHPRKMIAGRKR